MTENQISSLASWICVHPSPCIPTSQRGVTVYPEVHVKGCQSDSALSAPQADQSIVTIIPEYEPCEFVMSVLTSTGLG